VRSAQGQYERALDDLDAALDVTVRALETAWADAALMGDLKVFARDAQRVADRIGNGQIKANTSLPDLRTRALAVAERSERMVSTTIERSGGGWLMPPLIPGSWRTLSGAERQPEVERLRRAAVNSLSSASIGRVRKLDLPFYRGGALFEAEVLGRDQPAMIDYIRHDNEIVVLDGSSPAIHELNRAAPVRITNREQAAAYLRFFVASIQGDGGRFSWADQVDDLPWLPEASTAQRDSVRRLVRPLVLEEDPSGLGWRARGSVVYSRVLFTNTFRLYQDGYTEMVYDEPVRTDLAVTTEKFTASIRSTTNRKVVVLDSLQQEIARAERRARLLFNGDSFATAVAAGRDRVAGWRQVNTLAANDSSKTGLARALGSLAWYLLFARRPAEALAAAEEGLRTAPAETWIESNRAHALLQLERTTEAARVYRQYLGKEVDERGWEQVIRGDLDDLQKKGVFTAAQVELVEKWITGSSLP
jgi:tetratricopeptide (TPR) repeat protein